MVIYISDERIESLILEDNFEDFIEQLMTSYKEGKHIIVLTPKTTFTIINTNRFVGKTLKILEHYYSKSSTSLSNLSKFDYICEIVPNSDIECNYKGRFGKEYRKINIKYFIDSANFQKTILLGENLNDTEVYKIIANYYRKKHNLTTYTIQCSNQGGGGATVFNEFKHIFDLKEKFCISLLDSDKKTPSSNYGPTAKKVFDFFSKNSMNNLKCHLHIIEKHEIENLLPRNFFLEVYEKEDIMKKGIYMQIDSLNLKDPNSSSFVDFKNGLKSLGKYGSEEFVNHWYEMVLASGLKCFFVEEDTGINYYFKGYGSKIVEDFINFSNNNEISSFIETDSVKNDWDSIGNLLSSFIFGTQIIRI